MSRLLNVVLAVVVILLAAAKTGNEDYADAVDTWTEEKLARVAVATKLDRARIWSQRCARQGKDVLAKRADTGPWVIHCVPRRVLTVAEVVYHP